MKSRSSRSSRRAGKSRRARSHSSESHDSGEHSGEHDTEHGMEYSTHALELSIESHLESVEKAQRTLLPEVPTVELGPWLEKTKWNQALQGLDMVESHDLICKPESLDSGDKFQRLVSAWNRIVERCLVTLASIDHVDSLKWLATVGMHSSAHQKPFGRPQNQSTITKYSCIWAQFLLFVLRTAPEKHWGNKSSK
jgi:hypothetical protein